MMTSIFNEDGFGGGRPGGIFDVRICARRCADALGAEVRHGLCLRQGRQDLSYKMGTNNAGLLLKGAKKVPKGTLFFIGQNGQLYMRSGPYLEGDGKFMFGSN